MSLFQAREWWSKKPDNVEECDKGCLCVANIDNDSSGNGMYGGVMGSDLDFDRIALLLCFISSTMV
jgi:hypothetical protein